MPNLLKTLDTCKLTPTREQFQTVMHVLPHLLERHMQHGHCEDVEYVNEGIPADLNSKNEKVWRNAGINQEHKQRCKTMTHPGQIRLRDVEKLEKLEHERKSQEKAKFDRELERNHDLNTIKKLCTLAAIEPSGENLKHCMLKHFCGSKKVLMK